jgi:hypothetical protein
MNTKLLKKIRNRYIYKFNTDNCIGLDKKNIEEFWILNTQSKTFIRKITQYMLPKVIGQKQCDSIIERNSFNRMRHQTNFRKNQLKIKYGIK